MDFEETGNFLSARQVFHSAAELHGMVCGQVCANGDPVSSAGLLEIPGAAAAELRDLLLVFGTQVREQLQKNDYSFQPFLPDDEEELSLRLIALSDWCEGFNSGFGAAFAGSGFSLLPETQEVLRDFAAIAQVEEQPDDTAEQNEAYYMELVEYVRMGAISVYLQNRQQKDSGSKEPEDFKDHNGGSGSFH